MAQYTVLWYNPCYGSTLVTLMCLCASYTLITLDDDCYAPLLFHNNGHKVFFIVAVRDQVNEKHFNECTYKNKECFHFTADFKRR